MRSIKILLAALLAFSSLNLHADEAGQFDYWVLSLSWSPQFCAEHSIGTGSFGLSGSIGSGNSQQCERPYAFIVHGLWPQNENGYPEDCASEERVDSALVNRMLPLMPDPQLIRREWSKHGTCSGLSVNDYFLTTESVYRSLTIPEAFQDNNQYVTTSALDIKREFMNANKKLDEDQLVLECSGRFLREVRICYDRDFQFRSCGEDIRDRCRSGDIVLRPKK